MLENVGRRSDVQGDMASFINLGARSLNGSERNRLFRAKGDGDFEDVGWVTGTDRIEDARGLAVADVDGDGRLDLILQNYDSDALLLMNRSRAGHWLEVKLEGTRANRDAVGAKVAIEAGGRRLTREIATTAGYLSGQTKTLHFGLGAATKIDKLTVKWPAPSKSVQTFEDLPVDRIIRIVEGGPIGR